MMAAFMDALLLTLASTVPIMLYGLVGTVYSVQLHNLDLGLGFVNRVQLFVGEGFDFNLSGRVQHMPAHVDTLKNT